MQTFLQKKSFTKHRTQLNGLYRLVATLLPFLIVGQVSWGQLGLTNAANSATINFSSTISGVSNGAYTGAGFQSSPTSGQLNSNAWAVTGWSDGDLAFAGTRTTASTDYTRGAVSAAQTTGGFYAYTGSPGSSSNPAFMIQPGGSDFAPGTLTLRIVNNGTTNITQIVASYNLFVRNDQARSNSFNFSYSSDNSTYTSVSALDYTSTAAADASPAWVQVSTSPSRSTTITGLTIAPGGYFYIRWSSADVGGSGSRDEFGLDDIGVTATFASAVSEPEINIKQGTTNIASSTGSYSFGSFTTGASSSATTFTVENTGTIALTLGGTPKIAISGTNASEFTVNETSTASPVAASGSTTFTITFSPTSAGSKTASISIANNDTDENPYTFTITGAGVAPAPSLSISGTTAHGTVCPNNSGSPVTYTITNNGLAAATGVTAALSGTNANQFSASALSATTIPAGGGTATFTVTFTPTSSGSKSATITVTSTTGGSNSPTSSLTGTGATSVTQAVTSSAATLVAATTATLNGNFTTAGICPATIEKGFVYAPSATNSNPIVDGTDVVKVPVAGTTTGAYNAALNSFSQSTSYTFKAYVYNGTTYTYGPVQTFTTQGPPPANDDCNGAITLTPSASNSCITATSGTVANATQSLTAGTCGGSATVGDVWYKFVAVNTSQYITVVPGASFDAVVELRSGTCNGTYITCKDGSTAGGTEVLSATGLTIGATYLVRVYDYSNTVPTTPTFTICITKAPWETFETGSKASYTAGNVDLGSGNWYLSDALIGGTAQDRKNGSNSARVQNSGVVAMNFDLPTGIQTVSLYHGVFGTNATNMTWRLEASTNGGTTWNAYTSSAITSTSTSLVQETFTLNLNNNVRFRIVKLTGTDRINFDDIDYTPMPVTTPVFTLGSSSSRCSGVQTISYTANADNKTGLTYTLDATSLAAGNTINAATGAVTYTSGYTGTSIITATATGSEGPKSSTHTVTMAINTFTGTGNWSDGSHWSCGVKPASTEYVAISTGGNATLDESFTVANNLLMNETSTLTIGSGVSLTVTGTADFNGQHVTIKSDNSGTGAIGNSPGTINGASNVTIERYIPQNSSRAWRLLSLPTIGQTLHQAWQEDQAAGENGNPGFGTYITSNLTSWADNGFDFKTASSSLLQYDPSPDALSAVSTTNGATGTNSGYFVYIRGDRSVLPSASTISSAATTLRSTGSIYTGAQPAITIPADKSALIGNIYPAGIDLRSLAIDGGTESNFNVWDPKLAGDYGLGGYQTLTKNGADFIVTPGLGSYGPIGSIHNIIPSGMAFFVTATNADGTVTFTEAAKSGSNPSTLFSAPITKMFTASLYATGSDKKLADGAMLLLDENFSNKVDALDAKKHYNFGESFYITRLNKDLSVERRKPFTEKDTIYFGIENLKSKSYLFEFTARELEAGNLSALLEDNYTHLSTPVSLSGTTTVSFSIDANAASKAIDRFRLVFKSNSVLAVGITNAKAYATASTNVVEWAVSNQQDALSYQVEKSLNGIDFTNTATIAAAGTNYRWEDKSPVQGNNFYRIVILENSGSKHYSQVMKVSVTKNTGISIIPNLITNGVINMQFGSMPKGTYGVRLISTNGSILAVKQIHYDGIGIAQSVNIPGSLATGSYSLEIIHPDKTSTVHPVVIAK